MAVGGFKTVPLEVVGQTYEHRSRPLSSQVTMNLIPEFQTTGMSESALVSWPGSIQFASSFGDSRGITVFQNVLYQVSGTSLQSIASDGTRTTVGTVDGLNRCIFANDGTNLVIATGGTGYIYNGASVDPITDPQYENANSVAYLNSQFIWDGFGQRWMVSDVGDPTSIQSNNIATAASSPDDVIRVATFNENLYIFGTETIEPWWNSGTGNPPFTEVKGGTMNIGLASVYAVAATENFIYWLGNDRSLYRASQYQAQNLSTIAINHAFQGFSTVDDTILSRVKIDGQNVLVLSFPTAGETYAMNEASSGWFQLSTGADQARYIGQAFETAYSKSLGESKDGEIIELNLETYTDIGQTIIRQRVMHPMTGNTVGSPGKRLLMSRVQLLMETGVGLVTGQGQIPQMVFEASFDGGKSWTNQDTVDIGRAGEGRVKVEWHHLESFYEIIVRLTVSDPVPIYIYTASIDVKPAGW